jgi:hypothetical protein
MEAYTLVAAGVGVGAGFLSAQLAPCRPTSSDASTPPSWIFSVVWAALYAAQGVALVRSKSLLLFSVVILELMWPFVFCTSRHLSTWMLTPIIALCLLLLRTDDTFLASSAAATAAWLIFAQGLGARSLTDRTD